MSKLLLKPPPQTVTMAPPPDEQTTARIISLYQKNISINEIVRYHSIYGIYADDNSVTGANVRHVLRNAGFGENLPEYFWGESALDPLESPPAYHKDSCRCRICRPCPCRWCQYGDGVPEPLVAKELGGVEGGDTIKS